MSNQAEQISALINRIKKKLKGWKSALIYLYDNDDIIDWVLKEINHSNEQLKNINRSEQLINELEELIY